MDSRFLSFPIGIILILSAFSPAYLQEFICPTFFVELNGKCYFFSQQLTFKLDWVSARDYCLEYTIGGYNYDLLVYDDDINEPVVISQEMINLGYENATIGARDLGLSISQWAWVDGTILQLNSSFWDCSYPNTTETTHVALLTRVIESVAVAISTERFRLRDVKNTTIEYFICEGDKFPIT